MGKKLCRYFCISKRKERKSKSIIANPKEMGYTATDIWHSRHDFSMYIVLTKAKLNTVNKMYRRLLVYCLLLHCGTSSRSCLFDVKAMLNNKINFVHTWSHVRSISDWGKLPDE